MTHEAHDAGHHEPDEHEPDEHDCKYSDRAGGQRSEPRSAGEAQSSEAAETDPEYRDIERRAALALEIREDDLDPDTGLLGRALAVPYKPDFLGGPATGLVRWGRLAPWGPAILDVLLLRVTPRDSWMLATLRQHPLDTWFAMLGEVPNALVRDRRHVAWLVNRVIEDNGIPGHVLWRDQLPTHVRTRDGYFQPPEIRELVFGMAMQIPEPIVRQAIEDLRAYWLDPWERSAAQLRRSAASPSPGPDPLGRFSDRDLVEEWWSLVSHPDHIHLEEAQLDVAWTGRMRLPLPRPEEAA